jgi:hypothetical protein
MSIVLRVAIDDFLVVLSEIGTIFARSSHGIALCTLGGDRPPTPDF